MNPFSFPKFTPIGLLNWLFAPCVMCVWAGVGIAVGGGLSLLGMDQQRKANNKANDANKAAVDENNALEWTKYLMSRGINPQGAVTPGVIPTNYTTMNSRLPVWATVMTSAANGLGRRGFRVRGTGGQPAAAAPSPALPAPAQGNGSGNVLP